MKVEVKKKYIIAVQRLQYKTKKITELENLAESKN